MVYIRREFVKIFESCQLPAAEEAVEPIAKLSAVEKQARFKSPQERAALRQDYANPIFDDLEAWLRAQLNRLSGKTPLAKVIRYTLTRLPKARPYLDHGFAGVGQQHSRTRSSARHTVTQKRSVHGPASGRSLRRQSLYPDRDMQAQLRKSRSLACLGVGTHPRLPRKSYWRVDAVGISDHRRGAES